MLETLNKNMNLVEITLHGNRLSHSCLAKIKQIYQRNTKLIEEQEPNRLKAELYRLKYEHEKLEQARSELKKKKEYIDDLTAQKESLSQSMKKLKDDQDSKRTEIQEQIKVYKAKTQD